MRTYMEIIIAILLSVGSFFLGYFVSPKEIKTIQNVQNVNYVTTTTESYQSTMQGQVTTILNNTSNLQYLNVNINGATNITYRYYTNSNFVTTTN